MRSLFQFWIDSIEPRELKLVEDPPDWLVAARDSDRLHSMEHDEHGARADVPAGEVEELLSGGWRFLVGSDDFLELVYVQARYFYDRFFPRLNWIILDAPQGKHFVLGDRPVVWGFAGELDVPPAALRDPSVQLIAPLTRTVALVAYHPSSEPPGRVVPARLNSASARAAASWIAGPTEMVIRESLAMRAASGPC